MPTELTEIGNLANETFNAFFNASEEDKTAMRPAFLAANDAMLKEALGDFHNATENGGDKLVHGSGGISQPRAE